MKKRIASWHSSLNVMISAFDSISLHNPSSPQPLEVLRVLGWQDMPWLLHGFSTRLGGVSKLDETGRSGDLNLGFTNRDAPEAVAQNRQRLIDAISSGIPSGDAPHGLVTLKQMHSGLMRCVGRANIAERASMWGDGLITNESGVLLGIQTADCLPILIADPRQRSVGAFHAGWRGTLKGIVEGGVAAIVREFGSVPADLVAAIGPGIAPCCFVVGAEVQKLFSAKYPYGDELFTVDTQLRLDLVEANRRQLLASGIRPERIYSVDKCTSCDTNQFFSYRAERGKTGRLMAVIGIAPD